MASWICRMRDVIALPPGLGGRQVTAVGRRAPRGLDELDEDATGVLGVDEVDPAVVGPPAWSVVQHPHPLLLARLHGVFDARHPVRHLLHARSLGVEEPRD